MIYRAGEQQYRLVDGWAKWPEKPKTVVICGLAVDSKNRVHVLIRGKYPVTVFDEDGNYLYSWGEGLLQEAHGIYIDKDDCIYCTDEGTHTVSKFTPEGNLLQVLGNKNQPADTGYKGQLGVIDRVGPPFNRPTDIAIDLSGDIYVSDGYGNARIHKFAPDGTLILSWGDAGDAPGQFRLPHSVLVDKHDRVWVTDRENNRVQIFDTQGNYLDQWTDLDHPTDISIDDQGNVFVSELGRRVSIFNLDGTILSRWSGSEENNEDTLYISPHTISVDLKGDIYVGEVAAAYFAFHKIAGVDRKAKAIQKFVRIT